MSGAGSSSRQFLSSVANNPRSGWLEYLGLPEDLDEWTVEDVRSTAAGLGLSALVGPATAPAADASKANGAPIPPAAPARPRHATTPRRTCSAWASVPLPRLEPAGRRRAAAHLLVGVGRASPAVPEVCFRADFSLADPETFDVFSPPGAPAAGMVMVEKLTHYLDQVELTLLGEVATRSEGFFEALQSYHALKREVGAGVAAIETLRGRLRALEANLVHKSLRLPRLVRQRKNLEAVETRVRLLHAVWRTQPTIQQLLGAGDFPGALELIASSQQLLDTDLAGVASLAHLSSSLRETKASIQRPMNRDLLQVAPATFGRRPARRPRRGARRRPHRQARADRHRLLRLGVLHDGLTELLEQQKKDVRALVKRTVREGLRDVDDRKKVAAAAAAAPSAPPPPPPPPCRRRSPVSVAPAADEAAAAEPAAAEEPPPRSVKAQLAELGADEFEGVMAVVSEPLLVVLRRAAAIHAALQRACAAAAADGTAYKALDDSGDASVPYHARIEGQSAEMLHAVCELAHERYARVLKTRRDAHARLPLGEFVRVTKTAVEFVRDVQHLAGRACVALTTELQAGARLPRGKHDDACASSTRSSKWSSGSRSTSRPSSRRLSTCSRRSRCRGSPRRSWWRCASARGRGGRRRRHRHRRPGRRRGVQGGAVGAPPPHDRHAVHAGGGERAERGGAGGELPPRAAQALQHEGVQAGADGGRDDCRIRRPQADHVAAPRARLAGAGAGARADAPPEGDPRRLPPRGAAPAAPRDGLCDRRQHQQQLFDSSSRSSTRNGWRRTCRRSRPRWCRRPTARAPRRRRAPRRWRRTSPRCTG